ncbi:alpha/beta fold hydrolase [Streptomyces canus]|uniref:Pimeloyl-ACP methyl ester carboxylesterase n=1 Tax=Streptomyces canus TaxID=58343 RepID=A0AAW8FNE2_9ACTN|nr:alpha/beta fold hydrolase [Streptomyces canus]MDQ0760162.1 pimeloyl-ACP methyl ester carboxylesterase [Streptomyces canus]MDQ0911204.1 pimeloyl-ACP methyl ester carboxylesterase [Streptomyces canus]
MGRYDGDAFEAAYDKVLAKWPTDREALRVSTPFGTTHVNACGPADAPPLVLLPGGGGATSTSWYAQAAHLARTHRVLAVDLVGAPGRSEPAADRHPRTVADLAAWLDALLDGLGITEADFGGHSYGAWIALHYAVHAPDRMRRLFLLDPTQCFAGFKAAYLLRALPMLLRPTPARVRAFLDWETGGAAGLDPDWLRLQEAAAGFPAAGPVTGPRPAPDALRVLNTPVLLLVAANSRTHDPYQVSAQAGELLPRAEIDVVPGVSHHALPQYAPPELARRLSEFLAERPE